MNIIEKTLLLSLLCSSCFFGFTAAESDESYLLNLVWKCTKMEDLGYCLKLKAAQLLDKLVRMKEPLVLTDYLTLTKNPKISHYQDINESETSSEGKSLEAEQENLDKIMWEKLISLFTTRTIQLSLSPAVFEGRSKEDKIFKKGHGVFLMAAMMGGMMMKMAMAKVALIAGKALILGKIALVLSLIIALKKFTHGSGGGASEVVYTSAENAVGRKFKSNSVWDEDGGDLAYSAHKPESFK